MYERHSENNSLTYIQSLSVPFVPDNLIVNEHDQLIAAGHPKPLQFLLHEKNHREHRAPSEVVIFRHPKSSKFYSYLCIESYIFCIILDSTYERLLLTNGEILSASTVGGTYKQKLLVGALCDHGILLCQDLF